MSCQSKRLRARGQGTALLLLQVLLPAQATCHRASESILALSQISLASSSKPHLLKRTCPNQTNLALLPKPRLERKSHQTCPSLLAPKIMHVVKPCCLQPYAHCHEQKQCQINTNCACYLPEYFENSNRSKEICGLQGVGSTTSHQPVCFVYGSGIELKPTDI